eukprot:gene375-407_t
MALATLSQAVLEVTEDGEILYSFPPNIDSVVAKKSFLRKMQLSYEKIQPVVNYGFRISFGVFLLTSLFLVIIALQTVSMEASVEHHRLKERDRREQEENRLHGYHRSMVFNMNMHTLFQPDTLHFILSSQHDANHDRPMNFLEACYSFLFGDGDRNRGYEEKLWIGAAEAIRRNGGVVVAEQLAALLPTPPPMRSALDEAERVNVDESWLLPLVLKYNGNPVVSPRGHIVYRFDELMISPNLPPTKAVKRNKKILDEDKDSVPMEQLQTFSSASGNQLLAAGMLGVANFWGVMTLGRMLSILPRGAISAGLLGVARKFYPALWLYAIAYLAFPAGRWIYQETVVNKKIQTRNMLRQIWKRKLEKPDPILSEKLADRAEVAKEATPLTSTGSNRVIFNSGASPALEPDINDDKAWKSREDI